MTIFLDMDGVMADFVSGAIEAADLPLTHDQVTHWNFFQDFMTSEEFWKRIHATYEFWEGLEPYPWARELYDLCCGFDEVIFLSDSSHDDEAPSGKVKWLRRHGFLADDASNYMLGRRKDFMTDGKRTLIDDSTANLRGWTFGRGILFPQPWNFQKPAVDKVKYIREALEHFYG